MIARLKAERKTLQAALAGVETDFADLRKAAAADAARLREEFASQLGVREARYAETRALDRLGVTDDIGQDAIRRAWESQPKATRSENPAKWWASTVEAHKAAASKGEAGPELPPALAAYLPKVEPEKQVAKAGSSAQPRPAWGGAVVDQGVASRQAPAVGLDAILADRGITDPAQFAARLRSLQRG